MSIRFLHAREGEGFMTAGRLRSTGLVVSLSLALMLAVASIWAASAESKPKPVPEDRTATVQLLGVNDFHGNLEPPRQVDGRTVGGPPTWART